MFHDKRFKLKCIIKLTDSLTFLVFLDCQLLCNFIKWIILNESKLKQRKNLYSKNS